jgi:hypothetical protein
MSCSSCIAGGAGFGAAGGNTGGGITGAEGFLAWGVAIGMAGDWATAKLTAASTARLAR